MPLLSGSKLCGILTLTSYGNIPEPSIKQPPSTCSHKQRPLLFFGFRWRWKVRPRGCSPKKSPSSTCHALSCTSILQGGLTTIWLRLTSECVLKKIGLKQQQQQRMFDKLSKVSKLEEANKQQQRDPGNEQLEEIQLPRGQGVPRGPDFGFSMDNHQDLSLDWLEIVFGLPVVSRPVRRRHAQSCRKFGSEISRAARG